MKRKIGSLLIAFACFAVFMFGYDCYIKSQLKNCIDKTIYFNDIFTKNATYFLMDDYISDNTMVVLGSSELLSEDGLAFPATLFNNGYSDFNMILMGQGKVQSLPQTVNVGAISEYIKNGKVVLIISPQWFTKTGLVSEEYSSRFVEDAFVKFLQNDSLSVETKRKVSERVNELLSADPTTLKRVLKYESVYLDGSWNPFERVEVYTYSEFRSAKTRFTFASYLDSIPELNKSDYVRVDEIDFERLMEEAEQRGKEACTNNEYAISNDYYDTYIRDEYDELKDSNIDDTFSVSPEYDDLRLFLETCNELGLETMVISVPVNGKWYDYTGFPKEERNKYYQNIRDICSEYGATLADFSDREYEDYFLLDIMHLGWKGWTYVDKVVYDFYRDSEKIGVIEQ